MENNLYQVLKDLVDRQWDIKKVGGYIKHDKEKQDEFKKLVEEYHRNDAIIENIKDNYAITPLKLAEIISQSENDEYRLKIFREIVKNSKGEDCYSGRFMACYLNSQNEFFNSNENPNIHKSLGSDRSEQYTNNTLSHEDFEKLIISLKGNSKYIISNNDELTFVMTLAPSAYLEVTNFTNLIIYGRVYTIVSDNFQKTAKHYVKQHLEKINAEEFLKTNVSTQDYFETYIKPTKDVKEL